MPLIPNLSGYLALYGAILSTMIFVRDARSRWPRASVNVCYGDDPEGKLLQEAIAIVARVANRGRETILLESYGLVASRGISFRRPLVGSRPPQDLEVKPNQRFEVVIPLKLARGIGGGPDGRPLRVVFYDQLGREYTSRYFRPGEWVQEERGPVLTDLKTVPWWQLALSRRRKRALALTPAT